MDAVGLAGGALLLLVAVLLLVALLLAPIALLVWFVRQPGPAGTRSVPFTEDDEVAARRHR